MRVEFQDFYGQLISIHDETGSGNVRLKVNTLENINDLHKTPKEDWKLETDISLNANHLDILIGTLQEARRRMEEY